MRYEWKSLIIIDSLFFLPIIDMIFIKIWFYVNNYLDSFAITDAFRLF